MLVQELNHSCLVDTLNAQTAATNPLGKVGDAAHVVRRGARGVAAVGQVLLTHHRKARKAGGRTS